MILRLSRICLFVCCSTFLFSSPSFALGEPPVYNVGTVTDGNTEGDLATLTLFRKEMLLLAENEFELHFPKSMTLSAQDTAKGAAQALTQLFADPGVDLVLTLGPITSNIVMNWKDIPKPVIAPFAIDKSFKKDSVEDGSSGIKNLAYIDAMFVMDREVENFQKIVPFKKLAILLDQRVLTALPELTNYGIQLAADHGMAITLVAVSNSAQDAVAAIPEATEAVMVGPLYSFSGKDCEELARGLIERRLPGYSIASHMQVERGLLAGDVPKGLQDNLARRSAIAVQDILLGEEAGELAVSFARGYDLTINMDTARALDIYPALEIMIGANLLNEQRTDIERRLNLQQVIESAIRENLDLSASKRKVKAGEYSVVEARSPLLPQVGVGTGYRGIDEDRAALGGGSSPENAWVGTVNASQQIYSERSWAAYTVEEHRQTGREMNHETVRLNVIYQASVAYFNVLRAKTIEQLFKGNLKLTRANLNSARIRMTTGIAGPDEVYRWETKFATDKIDVLAKESISLDAMEAVNRILNRPLLELFIAEETDLSDPLLMLGDTLFYHLTTNPKYLHAFRTFAVAEAQATRPELKFLDAAIEAQRRVQTASGREIWLPDFSVEGSVDQYFAEGGSGQRSDFQDGLDDTDWQIGVFARLPLFEGGRKTAAYSRSREELSRLKIDRKVAADRVSQETLLALNKTRVSYPAINLSREAAASANRNLDLITDSYVQGIKSIIELLDAQNQALTADQAAANAVYNFLIDLMGVQRSMGGFIIFQSQEERDAWMEGVKQYLVRPPV